ncbi:phage tail protein [Streptococcus uberis]|nr:phage tail protein [Streptococcus uberis]MCK1244906.1 phage tail protein [Streptococcus uberis]MCK1257196.1 phage tail protein [Streptococcus uberis]
MKHYGITFNGRHSFKDEGLLLLEDKEITIPEKNKIVISPPYSNNVYDFSTVYGGQLYKQRTLTYQIKIMNDNRSTKEAMNMTETKVINWLMGSTGLQKLTDDAIPGYYFLAEVQGNSSFQEDWNHGVLKVTFKAYPFKISESAEGNDIWDDFNFELDAFQNVSFEVSGSLDILLVNTGISLARPVITASNNFTLTKDGVAHSIVTGSRTYDYFTLDKENQIHIEGHGMISFQWYKELI